MSTLEKPEKRSISPNSSGSKFSFSGNEELWDSEENLQASKEVVNIPELCDELIKDIVSRRNIKESQELATDTIGTLTSKIKDKLDNLSGMLRNKYFLWKHLKTLENVGKHAENENYRVFDPGNKKFYTKKIIRESNAVDFDEQMLKQIEILLYIIKEDDPALLQIYSIDYEVGRICSIIMEYGKCDLETYISFRKKYCFKWEEAELMDIASQLNQQLMKLKSLGIYHRDVQPRNIIFDENWKVKLTDFSLSLLCNDGDVQITPPVGNNSFHAPEIEEAHAQRTLVKCNLIEADIYSVGKILQQIIVKGKGPENFAEKFEAIMSQRKIEFEKDQESELLDWSQYEQELGSFQMRNLLRKLTTEEKDEQIANLMDAFLPAECLEMISKMLAEVMSEPIGRPKKEAVLLRQLANVLAAQGLYDDALPSLKNSLTLKLDLYGESHSSVAACYRDMGCIYLSKKDFDEALKNLEKALEIQLRVSGPSHQDVALIYYDLSNLHYLGGRYEEALQNHCKALAIWIGCFEEIDIDLITYEQRIGFITEKMQKPVNALLRILKTTQEDFINPYKELSEKFFAQENIKNAIKRYKTALKLRARTSILKDKNLANAFSNLGNLFYLLEDQTQAYLNYKLALALRPKISGTSLDAAIDRINLGIIYFDRGDYTLAIKDFEEALKYQVQDLGEVHLDIAITHTLLAQAYKMVEDLDRAGENLKRALDIKILILGKITQSHSEIIKTFRDLGDLCLWSSKFEEAENYYKKIAEIEESDREVPPLETLPIEEIHTEEIPAEELPTQELPTQEISPDTSRDQDTVIEIRDNVYRPIEPRLQSSEIDQPDVKVLADQVGDMP